VKSAVFVLAFLIGILAYMYLTPTTNETKTLGWFIVAGFLWGIDRRHRLYRSTREALQNRDKEFADYKKENNQRVRTLIDVAETSGLRASELQAGFRRIIP